MLKLSLRPANYSPFFSSIWSAELFASSRTTVDTAHLENEGVKSKKREATVSAQDAKKANLMNVAKCWPRFDLTFSPGAGEPQAKQCFSPVFRLALQSMQRLIMVGGFSGPVLVYAHGRQ